MLVSFAVLLPHDTDRTLATYTTAVWCRYDLGLIGGALLSMREEMHFGEGVVEVIVAAAKIGAFFGTFLGGGLMLYYGRRTTIALDSVFFMLGPIIMASASGIMCAPALPSEPAASGYADIEQTCLFHSDAVNLFLRCSGTCL